MRTITIKDEEFRVELIGTEIDLKTGELTAEVEIWNTWNYFPHRLKVYYRPERTWDDHMGNTPCGYYVNLPLPFNSGTKRWYLYQ